MNDKNYLPRLVDEKFESYLSVFGAVSIEGPKWCGKTWTGLKHSKSAVYLDDQETIERAKLNTEYILNEDKPELIDEWTLLPLIWDKVRRKCDQTNIKGSYILTCSTSLSEQRKKEVFHSGAGRIGKLKMYTMSLYESKDSTGECSIMDMYNNTQKNTPVKTLDYKDIADLIVRGGWPSNLSVDKDKYGILPKSYIESILDKDINDEKVRDKDKMLMLLRSLARNETTVATNQTLLKDISELESDDILESRNTLSEYLNTLDRLKLIENQNSYSENYRSSNRVGKSPKRHFTDPSLACALLNLNKDKLIQDVKTFGLLFEALVERDLRIYMEYLDGKLYHFRDNITGLEVDSVLEFNGGEYALVEIKLSCDSTVLEEAKKSLLKFSENATKKPIFMCIITANFKAVHKDPKTGIYIIPITSLRP